jgi:hypothetical protein
VDYKFIVNQIIETQTDINLTNLIDSLDYENACDTVIRNKLWQVMADEVFFTTLSKSGKKSIIR